MLAGKGAVVGVGGRVLRYPRDMNQKGECLAKRQRACGFFQKGGSIYLHMKRGKEGDTLRVGGTVPVGGIAISMGITGKEGERA